MEYLDIKLEQYAKSGVYPFHMPGHKRAEIDFFNPYQIDITEIEGFDNLHHAEEILKEAQKRAAHVFHAKHTFYLINGSTCGLLSAISAAAKKGDKILIARNCHKAVYHAAYLRELRVSYLYPIITKAGIQGAIQPEDVERMLNCDKDIAAVVITSPTYDGVVSDIESIAKIAHRHDVPLIVDEAHGAHFGFSKKFPRPAVSLGADVVIQSIHKTLPSFTQTALLHLQSERILESEIKKFLGIYETSSPSYIFMAGIDKCVRMLETEADVLFARYETLLNDFYKRTEKLNKIKILKKEDFNRKEAFAFDPSKIIISVKGMNMTGQELYDCLLKKYKLQMEMASGFYVTAMTSIMDRKEGFDRLIHALYEVDAVLKEKNTYADDFVEKVYIENEKNMEIYQAMDSLKNPVELEKAEGKISGEYIYLYPPGIPILVPGEIITAKIVDNIKKCGKLGLNIQGMVDNTNKQINIVNNES